MWGMGAMARTAGRQDAEVLAAAAAGDEIAFRRLIAEHHDSEAMAQIVKPNDKREEFICSGCQMSIPLENVNALMNSSNEIQTCHVCGRILYLYAPEPDRAATS